MTSPRNFEPDALSSRDLAHNESMSETKNLLRKDLTTSMKAKDQLRTATLRMVLTAVSAQEVAGKTAKELSDQEVVSVLTREKKRRLEAAEAFTTGQRPEQAAKELSEAEIIAGYLPRQLTDSEMQQLIVTAVTNAETVGLSGGRAMGAVMKELKPLTTGRVEGGQVAVLVKRALGMD
jgi:uncharacterized protein YqeY